MNGRLSSLSVAWIFVATASVGLCVYCGVLVLSTQDELSERIADLNDAQNLALKIVEIPQDDGATTEKIRTAIQAEVKRALAGHMVGVTVRQQSPRSIDGTSLFGRDYRISASAIELRHLIQLLQALDTQLPHLIVSRIEITPPKTKRQKSPEVWAVQIVLTHLTAAG